MPYTLGTIGREVGAGWCLAHHVNAREDLEFRFLAIHRRFEVFLQEKDALWLGA